MWRFFGHMWKHLSIWCWKIGEGHVSNEQFNEQATFLFLSQKKIRTEDQSRTYLNYFTFKWYGFSIKTLSVVHVQYALGHPIFIWITDIVTQFFWRTKSYTDIPKNLPSIYSTYLYMLKVDLEETLSTKANLEDSKPRKLLTLWEFGLWTIQ